MEAGKLIWADFEAGTRDALKRALPPEQVRRFTGPEDVITTNREQVVSQFLPALKLTGDALRGGSIFARTCLTCHSLAGQGYPVGPDISEVGHRAPELLLVDILDPNREVPPDYQSYRLVRVSGEVSSGLIVSETPTAVSFRQSGLADETIARSQIREMHPEGRSLMPEGLESSWSPEDMADLLAFLRQPEERWLEGK